MEVVAHMIRVTPCYSLLTYQTLVPTYLAFLTIDNLDLQKTQERIYKNFDTTFLHVPYPLTPATTLFT